MLLFLGGAARTGKGILARRLLAELQLPYLSLDVLKMGLTRGMPELAFDPDAGAMLVAERLWPLVREMSHNLLADQVPYCFEGELLPRQVARLRDAHPSQVSACFLGYATTTPARKLAELRRYAGHPNDWPQTVADAALLPIITREIAFSQYLRAECQTYRLPYVDTSEQFEQAHSQVLAYVRDEHARGQPLGAQVVLH